MSGRNNSALCSQSQRELSQHATPSAVSALLADLGRGDPNLEQQHESGGDGQSVSHEFVLVDDVPQGPCASELEPLLNLLGAESNEELECDHQRERVHMRL